MANAIPFPLPPSTPKIRRKTIVKENNDGTSCQLVIQMKTIVKEVTFSSKVAYILLHLHVF
jgi:hypothetical protein